VPRVGWSKPETDQRLSDHLAIAMLTTIYPPWLVDEAIEATGRLEKRQRMLPAQVVLYHLLAMALYEEASYEEVMRRLLEGIAWQRRWPTEWQVPTKAAIFKARTRLGVEPLAELFARSVQPLARKDAPSASYRGRPIIGVDHHAFPSGASSRRTAGSAVGTLELSAFVEGRTNVVLDLAVDGTLETRVDELASRLRPGAIYLTSRGVAGTSLWDAARAGDADLIFPVDSGWALTPGDDLIDGSTLVAVHDAAGNAIFAGGARLIDGGTTGTGRLLTTLTDPEAGPAATLQDLYATRPSVAACLDDLRVHQHAPTTALRSKSAEGALQEIYGLLLAHYAIRALLTDIDLAPIPASPRRPQPAAAAPAVAE
jgi:hypothetical protein